MFSASDDAAKKNAIAFELLGRGGADLIADMEAVAKSFDSTHASMSRTGKLVREEMLPAARELDAAFDELGQNIGGTMNRVAEAVLPVATQVVQAMNAMFAAARGEGRGFAGLGFQGAFRGAGAAIGGTIAGAGTAAGGDPLAKVAIGSESEARAKRLEELRQILRGTGLEAAKVLAQLEAIERGEKLQAILKKLDEARPLSQRLAEAAEFGGTPLERRGLGPSDAQLTVDQLATVPEKQFDALTRVRAQWEEFADSVLSAATILDESLSGLWNGLQSGFGTVFRNLTSETQTFASAMKTIFDALVQEILAMLARIAAAKAFSFILGLVFGGPAGAAAGAAAGGGSAIVGGMSAARAPVTAAGNTYVNIQSLDARTSLEQLVSPFGALRTAELRRAEAAA
jgi:hypothetical protein